MDSSKIIPIVMEYTCSLTFFLQKVVELQQQVSRQVGQGHKLETVDDIVEASLRLGMSEACANFYRGQLKNCGRRAKGAI